MILIKKKKVCENVFCFVLFCFVLFSCNQKENLGKSNGLALDRTSVTLSIGEFETLKILKGSGFYSAFSNNKSVATVSVLPSDIIEIRGISVGSCIIEVVDETSKEKIIISVKCIQPSDRIIAEKCKFLNGAKAYLSLSFDDSNVKHLLMAELLSKNKLKGSFYFISKYINDKRYDYVSIYKKIHLLGHEIGNHTVNHERLDKKSYEEIKSEIISAQNHIERAFIINCRTFAAPQAIYNQTVLDICQQNNMYVRNISSHTGLRPKFSIKSKTLNEDVYKYIENQMAKNTYALIVGHGIEGSGWEPWSKKQYDELFAYVRRKVESNDLWVDRVDNASLYEDLYYSSTLLINKNTSGFSVDISFPDKSIFKKFDSMPFSFKVMKTTNFKHGFIPLKIVEHKDYVVYTVDLKVSSSFTFFT